ncbi:MAG: HK97 family phage prohead protease [Alphaproteobacteria bacterium]|nr:HK97 family phage prohead protease [Alphaproteobacteria bacterium]
MTDMLVPQLQLKTIDDQGRFAGYASIFEVVDSQNDRMEAGAFRETLKENTNSIKLLWQHNFEEPIGVFTNLREDAKGLYVEGKLLMDVQRAKEAHALLKAGAICGLSIGYVPVRYSIEPDSGVRVLHEVALYEVSVVTFPANSAATVEAVKHQDMAAEVRSGSLIRFADEVDRAIDILQK